MALRCAVVGQAAPSLAATGEWRPGVWWHIGRREGGTSSGVERRHQMDYEGSEDGPRASSSSIWEYPKLTTTSRPLELDRLMVEEPAHRRGPSAQGMSMNFPCAAGADRAVRHLHERTHS